jgi:pantoate--beta-alanine ligase
METITSPADMKQFSRRLRQEAHRIGFVPTMGFLHQGHLSLVEQARVQGRCDRIVMSIFVNPLQFGPREDFEKYPRDFDGDFQLAWSAGVDCLFYPDVRDMYPDGARTTVEVAELGQVLCGVSRPTHFRGVTTVVSKLLNIVMPHVAVFGQKDAQQFFIVRRMVQDLLMDVELIRAPIVRETDGLALSSRNVYLNAEERKQAVCLYQSLMQARRLIDEGQRDAQTILRAMRTHIERHPSARIDHVAIVDTERLQPRTVVEGPTLIAAAVYIGTTRLIDNIIVGEEP